MREPEELDIQVTAFCVENTPRYSGAHLHGNFCELVSNLAAGHQLHAAIFVVCNWSDGLHV